MRHLVALLLVAGGCASGPRVISRGTTLRYTDRSFYWIEHQGAKPPEAVSGFFFDAGRITGEACGLDVIYDVWHPNAARTHLTGFVRPAIPGAVRLASSFFEVDDRGGTRAFRGAVGEELGLAAVDFRLSDQGLVGRVATRRYDLHAEGDDLVGTVVGGGLSGPARFVAHGRGDLSRMPAEDQAVVLPFLLSCAKVHNGQHYRGPYVEPLLEIDLRGQGFDRPPPVAPPGAVGPGNPTRT